MWRTTVIALLIGCGRIGFDDATASGSGTTDGSLGSPDTPGSVDCPNVGDACADGTIYAGITPDGNVRMYAEPTTSFFGGPWTYGTGNPAVTDVLTGMTNTVTGAANTAALSLGGTWEDADAGVAGVQPHESANYCTDLTLDGHTDWYLPALDELRVLSTNQVAIGQFVADEYWASNEDPSSPTDCALAIAFPSGNETSFRAKYDYRSVRCVRK